MSRRSPLGSSGHAHPGQSKPPSSWFIGPSGQLADRVGGEEVPADRVAGQLPAPLPAVACGREYGGQLQPPTRTRESNFLVFHLDGDHISARGSKYHGPFRHIKSFLPNETWYHFHARKVRPPLTSVAGPRHPAKALAANHGDQWTLVHLAATEADSKKGSEPARPRPVSTPPRRAGTPTMSQATVIAGGRNGRHIMPIPLAAAPPPGSRRRSPPWPWRLPSCSARPSPWPPPGAAPPPRRRRSSANWPVPGLAGRPEMILQHAFPGWPWNLWGT